MNILDRYVLSSFVKAWIVSFVSLLSLYVVIDVFNHFDDLLEASRLLHQSLPEVMAAYYGYQLVLIFDRLCSVILLLAAAFTIAWMQRQNELVPLLAAGVPIQRILRPIYIGSLFFLTLQLGNREVLMPRLAEHLETSAGDPAGQKERLVTGGFDTNGVLFEGKKAVPSEKIVSGFSCTVPARLGGTMFHMVAQEARFIPIGVMLPDGSKSKQSGWLLSNTSPPEAPSSDQSGIVKGLNTGQTFVSIERVDFRRMTRNKAWYQFANLLDIIGELDTPGANQLAQLATQLHMRLAAPLVALMTIALGLGIVLRESSKNVFFNTGLCLALAAGVFVITVIGRYLGEREYLSAALAGWLPLILFGPLAFTMRDAMQT
jgi:lipopolysaccharide export system permease protein